MADSPYLPPELLDSIADWIDSPNDLLAVALTNKTLAAVVVPFHVQLRIIQCPRDALCVWAPLAADATLARKVRLLQIGPYRLRIPRIFSKESSPLCPHCFRVNSRGPRKNPPPRQNDDNALKAALRKMENLTSFQWTPYNRIPATTLDATDREDMWSVLSKSPNVEDLRICEYRQSFIWESALFDMSNLTCFDYTRDYISFMPDCTRLGTMLRERCPKLQKLRLRFSVSLGNAPNIDETILNGHWPDLVRVHLKNTACSSVAIIAFLSAHRSLCDIQFDSLIGCSVFSPEDFDDIYHAVAIQRPLDCPPGILPNLRTLDCSPYHALGILSARKFTHPSSDSLAITLRRGYVHNPHATVDDVLGLVSRMPPKSVTVMVTDIPMP